MEAFFSGTVIFLYFIAHYAAEPIFVVSCLLPAAYGAAVTLSLAFGACGRMIAARRRARRFLRKGVIAGCDRALFYKKCVKRTPLPFRAAYSLFLNGKISAEELATEGSRAIRIRKSLLKGGCAGVAAVACLSVFLTFYFIVPIGETLLRTAVCAFHGALAALSLHFVLFGYALAGEKAAFRFVEMTDGALLREKGAAEPQREARKREEKEERLFSTETERKEASPIGEEENEDVRALREMLRDLDRV